MGGSFKDELLSDAVIIDVNAHTGHKFDGDMAFECTSNTVMIGNGSVYSLVSDNEGECFMISFSSQTNQITIVRHLEQDEEHSDEVLT